MTILPTMNQNGTPFEKSQTWNHLCKIPNMEPPLKNPKYGTPFGKSYIWNPFEKS